MVTGDRSKVSVVMTVIQCTKAMNDRCRRKFSSREQAMPFSQHLENFLTLNKFLSSKLKKKIFKQPPSVEPGTSVS